MLNNNLSWILNQDISGFATKEYVDNAITNLNINIDYDSLLAFDTTEIIRELNYVDNYIDNDNNLILNDDLPAGIYTLRYEFEDGTYSNIKNFIIGGETIEIDVMKEGEIYLNQRYSKSGGGYVTQNGILSILVPFSNINNEAMILNFDNLKYTLLAGSSSLYILDNNKSNPLTVNGNSNFMSMSSGVEVSNNGLSGTVTFAPLINEGYLAISVRINDTETEIVETDFENYVITLTTVKEEVDEPVENEPIEIDVMNESEIYLNKIFDKDNVSLADAPGIVTIALPIDFDGKTQYSLKIHNSPRSLLTYKDFNMLIFTDVNMTTMSYVNGSTHFGYMNEGCWTVSDDGKSLGVCVFTPPANKEIMYLTLMIKYSGDDLTITEADLSGLLITLEKEGGSN